MAASAPTLPPYLADCYLCPGNARVGGAVNPQYDQTSFSITIIRAYPRGTVVLKRRPVSIRIVRRRNRARGLLQSQTQPYPRRVIRRRDSATASGQDQYNELGRLPDINHVLIFENKGEVVGVSNPHPHCQIYATNFVFKTIETEARVSQHYLDQTGRVLFQDIIAAEQETGTRIIAENDSAIAFVPYFARYAYEVFVAPKATHPSLATLTTSCSTSRAYSKTWLVRFDNLWQMPFPYVMLLHQAPTDGGDYSGFHFHIEFHPPLRKPDLLKLAGPEVGGGNFQRHVSGRESAELRAIKRPLQRVVAMTDHGAHDIRKLLNPLRRLHEQIARQ